MNLKTSIQPKFSIITTVLNDSSNIEKTINSVLNQNFKNFEYIIIDGKSTDGTLAKIKKYENNLSYLISEKDKGIYDGFNKGMKKAQGEFICFVNSCDILYPNALETINKYAELNPNLDFIFGSVKKHWGIVYGYRPKMIKYSWGFYSSHSTGFFIKLDAAKKVGNYNLKYKYHADYDYFYRMIVQNKMRGISTKKNEVTGLFARGGFSSISPYRKMFFEELLIRYDNNQSILLIVLIGFYKFLKNFKRIIK